MGMPPEHLPLEHIQPAGGPGADPELTGGITYPICLGEWASDKHMEHQSRGKRS